MSDALSLNADTLKFLSFFEKSVPYGSFYSISDLINLFGLPYAGVIVGRKIIKEFIEKYSYPKIQEIYT